MIWPSAVSAPTLVASMTTLPARLIDPPMTSSPGLVDRDRLAGDQALVDGRAARHDAPVDRHLVARPQPDEIAHNDLAVGTSSSSPSRRTVAFGGTMSNSACRLSLVPLRLFISIQWPKSTKVTSMVAAS